MPKQVSKLINRLRSEYPELKDEPLLEDIEMAAYGDDEEMTDEAADFELGPEAEVPPDEWDEDQDEPPGEFQPMPDEGELKPVSPYDAEDEEEPELPLELPPKFRKKRRKA